MPRTYYVREDEVVYPTYSVLQENEAGDYLDLICGGLGLTELEAYASYPEVRPVMNNRWDRMKAKRTYQAPIWTNFRVARAITKAQARGPMVRPTIIPRSELERMARGGEEEDASPDQATDDQRNAMLVAKARHESPRYAAHIQECEVCFRDGGPYPFEPCPEGKKIMREEWLEKEGS